MMMDRSHPALNGPAKKIDVDSELAVLDAWLVGAKHPIPKHLRQRVLELATGISARSPPADCLDVNTRIRAALGRHGIFRNELRPR